MVAEKIKTKKIEAHIGHFEFTNDFACAFYFSLDVWFGFDFGALLKQ